MRRPPRSQRAAIATRLDWEGAGDDAMLRIRCSRMHATIPAGEQRSCRADYHTSCTEATGIAGGAGTGTLAVAPPEACWLAGAEAAFSTAVDAHLT